MAQDKDSLTYCELTIDFKGGPRDGKTKKQRWPVHGVPRPGEVEEIAVGDGATGVYEARLVGHYHVEATWVARPSARYLHNAEHATKEAHRGTHH